MFPSYPFRQSTVSNSRPMTFTAVAFPLSNMFILE
jgi:hypothetical protein